MARRRGFLDAINPVRWLERIVDALTPGEESAPSRRRAAPPPPERIPPGPPGGGPSNREFKDVWDDAGAEGGYHRARDFFDSLPAQYESADEELDVWDSFVNNMILDGPYKKNDPQNPFWSDIALSPTRGGGFNWSGWRAMMGYNRK